MPTCDPQLLTDRELQIVRLAARGMTDKEICSELNLSLATVRTHWVRLRRKMKVSNRSQAVAVVQSGPASGASDEAGAAISAMMRDIVGFWTWHPGSKHMLLDETSKRLFRVEGVQRAGLKEVLDSVWPPDRGRVEIFLLQAPRSRSMSVIEFRVGPEKSYGDVVRTVNLSAGTLKEFGPSTLMATRLERSLLV